MNRSLCFFLAFIRDDCSIHTCAILALCSVCHEAFVKILINLVKLKCLGLCI
jgi:hypothetical protein